jgi:drug/metabolite transporter (DMT)-like permease
VFVILGSLALGIVPALAQWIAMAAVMVGVWLVATGGHPDTAEVVRGRAAGGIGVTVAYALIAAFTFTVAIFAAREAVPIYGGVQSVWFTRIVSLVCLLALMAFNRETPRLPIKWWPAVTVQGALDTLGMYTMFVGSVGDGAPLAAVGSAPVAVFTVLLARVFLREAVPPKQWLGIALVVAAGGALAYLGHG